MDFVRFRRGSGAATVTETSGGDGALTPLLKEPILKPPPSEECPLDDDSLLAFPEREDSMMFIICAAPFGGLPMTGGLDATGSSRDNGRFDFFEDEAEFFRGNGTDSSEAPKEVLCAEAEGGGGFMSKEVLKCDAEGGGSEG